MTPSAHDRHCCSERSAHSSWSHLPAQKPHGRVGCPVCMVLDRDWEACFAALSHAEDALDSMQLCPRPRAATGAQTPDWQTAAAAIQARPTAPFPLSYPSRHQHRSRPSRSTSGRSRYEPAPRYRLVRCERPGRNLKVRRELATEKPDIGGFSTTVCQLFNCSLSRRARCRPRRRHGPAHRRVRSWAIPALRPVAQPLGQPPPP